MRQRFLRDANTVIRHHQVEILMVGVQGNFDIASVFIVFDSVFHKVGEGLVQFRTVHFGIYLPEGLVDKLNILRSRYGTDALQQIDDKFVHIRHLDIQGIRCLPHLCHLEQILDDPGLAVDLDGDILQETGVVIEFGNETLRMPYNNAMDNRWQKDFQRTVYLGGSVQGDWNPGVTRDLSLTCDATNINDLDQIETIRDLAEYPGICHVRTPDGSSFNADIQVSESRPYDKKRVNYSFEIKKVDPQGYEGMTLEEWDATHEDE